MDKVDIFLVDNYYGTPFLSIPKRDIQRLSIYPHKWLRFVLFAICGAHGQLSATQKGPAVQDDAGFTDLCTTYYYTPYGMALFFVITLRLSYMTAENQRLCFVDHNVHNDRITSTADTQRSSAFRKDIIERDRACVLTGSGPKFCDAAHIIPMKKGDAVSWFLKTLM
jgi:hypothetical protein